MEKFLENINNDILDMQRNKDKLKNKPKPINDLIYIILIIIILSIILCKNKK
jgi:hypothetical protein